MIVSKRKLTLSVICRDVNRSKSVRSVPSKLPNFELIFFKKVINKTCSRTFFRVGCLLVKSDKIRSEVRICLNLKPVLVSVRSASDRSVPSKLPNFEMIFLKKIINKIYSQVIFRVGYLLEVSDHFFLGSAIASRLIGPIWTVNIPNWEWHLFSHFSSMRSHRIGAPHLYHNRKTYRVV